MGLDVSSNQQSKTKYPMKNKEMEIFFLQNDWEFPPIINNKNNLLESIFGGMDSSNVSGNSSLKTKITI